MLTLALPLSLAGLTLSALAALRALNNACVSIGFADHFLPSTLFLLGDIFICFGRFRGLISGVNRLARRRFCEGFGPLFIQVTARFWVQTVNGFNFWAYLLTAAASRPSINVDIFENITRVTAPLRAAIGIFIFIGLARLRVILRRSRRRILRIGRQGEHRE